MPPFYPSKNIKVDPIIRIILVPPLSSVKLSRAVFRGMGGGMSPLNQKPIPLESQNEMTLSTGVYGEPPVWVPVSPAHPPCLGAPSFWKRLTYTPANETAQNTIEFEHGHKRQLLSRSTIIGLFMIYLLYITCKALIWKNALICNSRFHLVIDSK